MHNSCSQIAGMFIEKLSKSNYFLTLTNALLSLGTIPSSFGLKVVLKF